jgi:hypothetical protein
VNISPNNTETVAHGAHAAADTNRARRAAHDKGAAHRVANLHAQLVRAEEKTGYCEKLVLPSQAATRVISVLLLLPLSVENPYDGATMTSHACAALDS